MNGTRRDLSNNFAFVSICLKPVALILYLFAKSVLTLVRACSSILAFLSISATRSFSLGVGLGVSGFTTEDAAVALTGLIVNIERLVLLEPMLRVKGVILLLSAPLLHSEASSLRLLKLTVTPFFS